MGQHIAHLNYGLFHWPFDDPRMAEFANAVDTVNELADRAQGFVWRATDGDTRPGMDPRKELVDTDLLAATLSAWESPTALEKFTHQTLHGKFLGRRADWFQEIDKPTYVIWPIAEGHIPTFAEGAERLAALKANGAGPDAYDFAYLAGLTG